MCGFLEGSDFSASCHVKATTKYILTTDTEVTDERVGKKYFKKQTNKVRVSPFQWYMYVLVGVVYERTADDSFMSGKKYYLKKGSNGNYVEVNPKAEGYLIENGSTFVEANTTTVQEGINYYAPVDVYYEVVAPENPAADGLYEMIPAGKLELKCGDYYTNFEAEENILETAVKPRDIIPMGANLIIFPDMKYVNTKGGYKYILNRDTTIRRHVFQDSGDMQWEVSSVESIGVKYCTLINRTDEEGNPFTFTYRFNVEENPKYLDDMSDEDRGKVQGPINDKYVLETSTGTIYYWIPSTRMWMTTTTYVSLTDGNARQDGVSIFENIHDGDGIRIEGISVDNANIGATVLKKVFDITDTNPKGILKGPVKVKKVVGEGIKTQIVLDIKTTFPSDGDAAEVWDCLTYKNYIPKMDFVIENKNRLWGCRYGLNNEGEFVNEIYASKLGDFRSWESFSGVSTDSYMVSVGSDGPFTGAISYLGRPMFFKENCIHTIYGEYPAQYQMMNTECKGVQEGCGASLVVIDGVLYYKSPSGVSAYTGSMPIEIGEKLNEKQNKYSNAVGCGYKGKYFLAMNKGIAFKELYIYDIARGIWCKEDKSSIARMCSSGYGVDEYLKTIEAHEVSYWLDGWKDRAEVTNGLVEGSRYKDDSGGFTKNVEWYAETGDMGLSSNQKKYISRIDVRMSLDVGSKARIFVQYDSSGKWEQVGVLTNTDLAVVSLPIKIKRCDHFRLRFEGKGQAKIYSLSKTLREGSAK